MKAIITTTGRDRVGILAAVAGYISEMNCNVEDISQTVMQGNFVMIMMISLDGSSHSFEEVSEGLSRLFPQGDLTVSMQRAEIFDAMHRV